MGSESVDRTCSHIARQRPLVVFAARREGEGPEGPAVDLGAAGPGQLGQGDEGPGHQGLRLGERPRGTERLGRPSRLVQGESVLRDPASGSTQDRMERAGAYWRRSEQPALSGPGYRTGWFPAGV